ncbi:MAG: hypothetical protein AAFZ18_03925 [Myxococcota bacterium]
MNSLFLTAFMVAANPTTIEADGESKPESKSGVDVMLQPFAWQELLRTDYRPLSPLTEYSNAVNAVAPLPFLPGRSALLFSYRHDALADDLEGGLAVLSGRSLHAFEVGLPMNLQIAEDWAINIDPRFIYNGDLEAGSTDGIDGSFRIGATWRPARDLALSLAVLPQVNDPIPVPVLGVYWRPNPGFRIDALLPRYAEISANLIGDFSWFGMFHFEGRRWVTPDLTQGDEDNAPQLELRRTEIRLQTGFRALVFGPIGFEVSGQWTPWQQLGIDGGDTIDPDSLDDLSVTASIGLLNL